MSCKLLDFKVHGFWRNSRTTHDVKYNVTLPQRQQEAEHFIRTLFVKLDQVANISFKHKRKQISQYCCDVYCWIFVYP